MKSLILSKTYAKIYKKNILLLIISMYNIEQNGIKKK